MAKNRCISSEAESNDFGDPPVQLRIVGFQPTHGVHACGVEALAFHTCDGIDSQILKQLEDLVLQGAQMLSSAWLAACSTNGILDEVNQRKELPAHRVDYVRGVVLFGQQSLQPTGMLEALLFLAKVSDQAILVFHG